MRDLWSGEGSGVVWVVNGFLICKKLSIKIIVVNKIIVFLELLNWELCF